VVRKITKYNDWLKKGVPAILIPGLILASIYGYKNIDKIKNYYNDARIFPKSGMVESVEDGDTFVLKSGHRVRLIGVDAPNRSNETDKDERAQENLAQLIDNKKVWLEYDRYQNDKYGRILAWVWVNCESLRPKFKEANYMHLSGNESREYLTENPDGCKKGLLINREMVEKGQAKAVEYENRGRLKYEL